MRRTILKHLKAASDYISGESLSQELNISRAAVNKHVQALRAMGYTIESVTNRGYRLQAGDFINQLELEILVADLGLPLAVEFHETIDSTNQRAKQCSEPSVIVALQQTQGKGRRGRDWISHKGQGLYFSLALMPELAPQVISAITQLAGLMVAKSIDIETSMKWPNDIYIEGKKLSGILTELVTQADYIEKLIIGIGVNFRPVDDIDTATSLEEAGSSLSMLQFLAVFLDHFFKAYPQFLEQADLSPWLEEINQRSYLSGKQVVIDTSGESGVFVGIDAAGHAIIRGDQEHALSYGEISLKGWQ